MSTIHKAALFTAWVCVLALVLSLLACCARAVKLSIVGHVAGQGLQMLNYTGDALNVSIAQNGTAWTIVAGGHA